MSEYLLDIENLKVSFHTYAGEVQAVRGVSLKVNAGECIAIVGESGSGKTVTSKAVLGLIAEPPGEVKKESRILFEGKNILDYTEKEWRNFRGKDAAMIFQDPMTSLNPTMKVGKQIIGAGNKQERARRKEKMQQIFERYHLESSVANLYPYQLSGGMARRVLISGAVMNPAKLIVADEPTPGLQESLARETLQNFRELAEEGCGVLLITHDIDLALQMADRIAIFYDGRVLETAPAAAFRGDGEELAHPYSKAFLKALPQNEFAISE